MPPDIQTPPTDALAIRLARSIGNRYRLTRELGEGGMSVVYEAHDNKLNRNVALKVLRPELGALVGQERFLREIRITAALQHPNVLPLLESGEADHLYYFTMPVAHGPSLRDRLVHEAPLPVPDVLSIAADIAEALDYAHALDVVHRDIKPENVLLVGGRAIVTDFGIARAVVAAGGEQVTSAGVAVGTPAYMSPEQSSGGTDIDGRADIYALGCVVYEMLAGEPPFTGPSVQAVLAKHIHERPPSLAVVRPGLSPGIVAAVERSLAKTPADRFPTAGAFATALKAGAEPGSQRSPTAPASIGKRVLVAAVLVGVAALAALAVRDGRPLDADRVVVFPLATAGTADSGLGADIATYLGNVLEGAEPLRWINGNDLSGGAGSSRGAFPRLARRAGAAWYVDGSVTRFSDSVTVVLLLRDARTDTVAGRTVRYAALPTSEVRLAAAAVAELVAPLLMAGTTADPGLLAQRRPAAITEFVAGERAYARADFARALEHYRRALAEDSLFPLAAMKGAQSASWIDRYEEQQRLVGHALRHRSLLPRRHVVYLEGLAAYLDGDAQSAISSFRRALAMAPEWMEAWTSLGEVYQHLLVPAPHADSQALAAFAAARRYDERFVVPRYHLAEADLLHGNQRRGQRMLRELGRVWQDSSLHTLAIIERCVAGRMARADWHTELRVSERRMLTATRAMAPEPQLQRCAEEGLRALIESDSVGPNNRFAALAVFSGLQLRAGKIDSLRSFLTRPPASAMGGPYFMLEFAPAYQEYAADAGRLAESMGTDYRARGPTSLWLLGRYEAYLGSPDRASEVSTELERRVRTDTSRSLAQLAALMSAHAALARRDTALAIQRFEALRARVPRSQLTWAAWEAFGFERLVHARLLAATDRPREAIRIASLLDAPQPVPYLGFVRPSLDVRLGAARQLGDQALIRQFESRLSQLDALMRGERR